MNPDGGRENQQIECAYELVKVSFSHKRQSRIMDLGILSLCNFQFVYKRFLQMGVPAIFIVLVVGIGSCPADRTPYEWNVLGESYYSDGNYDAAISAYLNAVSINPSLSEAWNNLGVVYEATGRYDDALQALNRAVSLNPRYSQAWNNLGDVYTKLGRDEDARKAYQQATSVSNDYTEKPPFDQRMNQPLTTPSFGNQPDRRLGDQQSHNPLTGTMNPEHGWNR